jgi:hypothetical protein
LSSPDRLSQAMHLLCPPGFEDSTPTRILLRPSRFAGQRIDQNHRQMKPASGAMAWLVLPGNGVGVDQQSEEEGGEDQPEVV